MLTNIITRRLTFEAGHRLVGHESKCRHLHGHSYKAYITVSAPDLDPVGRVIDFSEVKNRIGKWIEINWDHAFICHKDDLPLMEALLEDRVYSMDCNPTAENMAKELFHVCRRVLPTELTVVSVRLDETENCSATYTPGTEVGQRIPLGSGDWAA